MLCGTSFSRTIFVSIFAEFLWLLITSLSYISYFPNCMLCIRLLHYLKHTLTQITKFFSLIPSVIEPNHDGAIFFFRSDTPNVNMMCTWKEIIVPYNLQWNVFSLPILGLMEEITSTFLANKEQWHCLSHTTVSSSNLLEYVIFSLHFYKNFVSWQILI